jgi:hypothetical protein
VVVGIHSQVLLLEILPIEEVSKVDQRVLRVVGVPSRD